MLVKRCNVLGYLTVLRLDGRGVVRGGGVKEGDRMNDKWIGVRVRMVGKR